jgi:hypothetical protein
LNPLALGGKTQEKGVTDEVNVYLSLSRSMTSTAPKILYDGLGMDISAAGNPDNPDSFPVHGVAQKLDRLRCGGLTSCSSPPRP